MTDDDITDRYPRTRSVGYDSKVMGLTEFPVGVGPRGSCIPNSFVGIQLCGNTGPISEG